MKHKTTPSAYQLLHEGAVALAEVESVGIRVDRPYLINAIADIDKSIADVQERMRSDKNYPLWRKTFGGKTNIGSGDQLGELVFDRLGYVSEDKTATGKHKTDKEALEKVDLPIVKDFVRMKELHRDKVYYLEGILRDCVERDGMWFIHPSFMLNTTRSFRSSSGTDKTDEKAAGSKELNFQNIPARDPARAAMIRRAYIPRPNRHFVENDLAQLEVRIPASITGDTSLEKYVKDKSTDMHRDCAAEVFMIKAGAVYWGDKKLGKAVRAQVKNFFVFASFYGSAYYNCAKKLWADVERFKLKGPDGKSLYEWLRKKGVTSCGNCEREHCKNNGTTPGTFVHHVRQVQNTLWGRFSAYGAWRKKVYEDYQRDGSAIMATGFVVVGPHGPNEPPNYLIQGPGFHYELKTIIEVLKRLKKYKMKSKVLGQVHDSNQGDVLRRELQAYLDIQHEVVSVVIPKLWPWVRDIPMEVESEVSDVGLSWHEKRQWVKTGGLWAPKG